MAQQFSITPFWKDTRLHRSLESATRLLYCAILEEADVKGVLSAEASRFSWLFSGEPYEEIHRHIHLLESAQLLFHYYSTDGSPLWWLPRYVWDTRPREILSKLELPQRDAVDHILGDAADDFWSIIRRRTHRAEKHALRKKRAYLRRNTGPAGAAPPAPAGSTHPAPAGAAPPAPAGSTHPAPAGSTHPRPPPAPWRSARGPRSPTLPKSLSCAPVHAREFASPDHDPGTGPGRTRFSSDDSEKLLLTATTAAAVVADPDDRAEDGAELHRQALAQEMLAFGVARKVVKEFLDGYSLDELRDQLAAAPYRNVQQPAGAFVQAVRGCWPLPNAYLDSRARTRTMRTAVPSDFADSRVVACAHGSATSYDGTPVEREWQKRKRDRSAWAERETGWKERCNEHLAAMSEEERAEVLSEARRRASACSKLWRGEAPERLVTALVHQVVGEIMGEACPA